MSRLTAFSSDRRHRFTLWREWDENKLPCVFICLNPSTADEQQDDPTVRRCIDYAKRWGYGSFCMLNLFSLRATDPKVMKASFEPHLPANDLFILETVAEAGHAHCAWGNDGAHFDRAEEVLRKLRALQPPVALFHLGLTGKGQPKHPLYLKADTDILPFEETP